MLKKILNLFPERAFPNFGIGSVALILSIASFAFASEAGAFYAVGVVLALVSILGFARWISQNLKGKE